jgi:glucokinase
MCILLADIGGSYTRCAIADAHGPMRCVKLFTNEDFASTAELLAAYISALIEADKPRSAHLAIAAPVLGDRVQMINRAWGFSQTELRLQLGLQELTVMNDFAAQAWAVSGLAAGESVAIGSGGAQPNAPRAVLGPGTGLGVAAVIWADGHSHVLPGEGGHVSLPAQNAEEEQVVRAARDRYGHCSAERILSGPGLSFLYSTLSGRGEVAPAEIGQAALSGAPDAIRTFEIFFRLLGTVAADLALTLGAFGGVYITGGIVPRYVELMRRSGFRERFEAKGRYAGYLSRIATHVVSIELPGLQGLLSFANSRKAK